jgi:hypothetical protein
MVDNNGSTSTPESSMEKMMDEWDREIAILGENRRSRMSQSGDDSSSIFSFLKRMTSKKKLPMASVQEGFN